MHACKCPDAVGCVSTEFAGICGQIREDLKVLRIHLSPPPAVSCYILELKVSDRLHKTLHYFPRGQMQLIILPGAVYCLVFCRAGLYNSLLWIR